MRAALRYVRWTRRNARAVAWWGLAAGVACAGIAATLPVRTELERLLPDDAPAVVALRRLEERKPAVAVIEVGIASRDAETTRAAASWLLRALRERLPRGLAREVDDEDAAIRFFRERPWLILGEEELRQLRDGLAARLNPLAVALEEGAPLPEPRNPAYVGEEGRLRMLVVRAPFGDTDPARARTLIEAVERIARDRPPGVEIGLAGDAVTAALEHDLVLRDVLFAAALCLATVLGLLAAAFRSARAVLSLGASLLAACAVTFAAARFAIGSLNTATAFLGSIVAGNGINAGIVLLARYRELRLAGRAHPRALRDAMLRTAVPTLAATSAAAAAYLSLLMTSFRGFSEFGAIASTGVLVCWGSAYLVLPALLTLWPPRFSTKGSWRPVLARPPRLVALALLALGTIPAAIGALRLASDPFEDDLGVLRSRSFKESEPGRWSRRLDAAFGRDQSGGFYVGTENLAEVREVVAAIDQAQERMPPAARVFGRTDALPVLLPPPPEQERRLALARQIVALARKLRPGASGRDALLLDELLLPRELRPVTVAELPERLRALFTEKDGRVGLLVVIHPGPAFQGWSYRGIARVVDLLRTLPLPEGVRRDLQISGPEFIFVDIMAAVRRDAPRAATAAFATALLFLLLALGRGSYALAGAYALAVGTLGMLGLLALLDQRLNFLSAIAVPITVGIAVDYPVNVLSRMREGGDVPATSRAVVLCSLTTMIGYAVLLVSDTGAIRSFGIAAVLGEITCLAAALLLAPSLLALCGPRAGRCERRSSLKTR